MKKAKRHPKAIEGIFAHIAPNGKIHLSREKITVTVHGKGEIKTRGNLYLELSPSFNFSIRTKLSNKSGAGIPYIPDEVGLQIDRSPNSSWFITSINSKFTDNKQTTELVGKASRANIDFHPADNLSYTNFHIVNFSKFLGQPIEFPNGRVAPRRLELRADDWIIKIDSTPYTEKNLEYLKKSSGYAITHVGKLEKTNRKSFSSEDTIEIATQLMYFLSFANGMWVNPILFSGINKRGQDVWQGWFIHHSRPWKKPSFSWYDSLHATEILPSAFSGYIRASKDSLSVVHEKA